MRDETSSEIKKYCDRYGNKLVELMDLCGVYCLQDVPEEIAVSFLKKLRES